MHDLYNFTFVCAVWMGCMHAAPYKLRSKLRSKSKVSYLEGSLVPITSHFQNHREIQYR